jgi:type II secretory ATPase GspE/PulE/Tfp pilus assembly ATPase PilB-like protein
MAIDESVRRQIAQGANGPEICSQALSNGMVPMQRAGMILAEQGVTTFGEVFRGVFFLD